MSKNNDPDSGAFPIGGFGFAIDGNTLNQETVDDAMEQLKEQLTTQELVLILLEKVAALDAKIELIFGNHVFIKGRLVNLERDR